MLIDLHFFVPSLFQLVLSLHFSVEIWTVRWWLNIMICFKFCWDFCLPGLYHTVTWLFSAWVFHWWAHPGHIFIMSRTSEMDYQTWTISVSWKQVGPLTPVWEVCTSAAGWPLPPQVGPLDPPYERCVQAQLGDPCPLQVGPLDPPCERCVRAQLCISLLVVSTALAGPHTQDTCSSWAGLASPFSPHELNHPTY